MKLTKNVKRYLASIFWRDDWENPGQGWEGREGEIKLHGWRSARRIIAPRQPLTGDVALADETPQLDLAFVECDRPAKRYEYAVLATDLPREIRALAQLYRDRADSENTFDELKNRWGWGGYITQDLKRSRFTAMMTALVYTTGGLYSCGWLSRKRDWRRLSACMARANWPRRC